MNYHILYKKVGTLVQEYEQRIVSLNHKVQQLILDNDLVSASRLTSRKDVYEKVVADLKALS